MIFFCFVTLYTFWLGSGNRQSRHRSRSKKPENGSAARLIFRGFWQTDRSRRWYDMRCRFGIYLKGVFNTTYGVALLPHNMEINLSQGVGGLDSWGWHWFLFAPYLRKLKFCFVIHRHKKAYAELHLNGLKHTSMESLHRQCLIYQS